MYCAIIGDLVKSKHMSPTERNNLQNKLDKLLTKINNDYKNNIAAKFIITLGDEFQGLLSTSYLSVEIIEKIIKEIYPHNIRFGIGISDIYTDIKPNWALFADGPAYHFARNAIDELKKTKNLSYAFAVRYETNNADDMIAINRICKLIDVITSGWTPKQREIVGKMFDTAHQQNKVAKALDVNASTVSRILKGAYYKDYKESLDDLKKFLQNRYDFALQDNELANAASLHNTGLYLFRQGKYDEALQKLQQALEIRKNKSAKETEIADTYNIMGDAYYTVGKYDNALDVYERSLSIREKELGVEHQDTADVYNNIGGVYRVLSDYDKALEFYNNALSIREKVLGVEHLDTATSYNNLGDVYYVRSEYKKALELYEKALTIREKVYGVEHPTTADSYNNIGLVCCVLGKYAKALEHYTKALVTYEKVYGVEHPTTAIVYHNIATTYVYLSDYDKAREFYEKALTIYETREDEYTDKKLSIYRAIASIYKKLNDSEKAMELV